MCIFSENIKIVNGENGNVGITLDGMGDKPLLEFDKNLLWLEELPSKDKNNVRLGVFSINDDDGYLIEEVTVDVINKKYFRILFPIARSKPKRVNGSIYKYYDVDNRLCLLDFKTNLLRVGEDASKYLNAYESIGKYFGENTFWEELPEQENINGDDLKRLYKKHYQDVPMNDFVTIAVITNMEAVSDRNVLLKVKVNLNGDSANRERKFEIIKFPDLYTEATWVGDYTYQVVENNYSTCLVNVRDEEIKVSRIEEDIRASLSNCKEKVTNFEIKPFKYGNIYNPLMREIVISFSNFERLHFIMRINKDNPDSYEVYNMVYSCSYSHYKSILSQHRATNVFLNKETFLIALSKLRLKGKVRKPMSEAEDTNNLEITLMNVGKTLSRRKLLTDL